MRPKTPKLTHERLLEVLSYDSDTGKFYWLIKLGKGNVGHEAGSSDDAGYLRIMIDCERLLAHRLAWFYVYRMWPLAQIDHRNVNNSDNRIDNLREATQGQNQANRGMLRNNTTGFKGVSFHKKQNKFFSRIRVDGKLVHLGCFSTGEEAHAAYVVAINDRYPDFARTA